eukprot:GHVL01022394.1.p1 GENE.GHVL01022394.1~~GHVL01022394.1.p1  ORF type:complete len:138 (+),score=24.72 GHVL01022394.1:30-443(+)
MANHQDWTQVVWDKKPTSGAAARDKNAVNQAFKKGERVEVVKKYAGGKNSGAQHPQMNTKTLDEDNEHLKHARVSHEFRIALQQARQAKGMTQQALAQEISEKGSVINEYENGKAIPNGQVVQKLNRALGTTLPKAK